MPNELDLMIKRLEEANERAREKFARVDERVSVSEDEVARVPDRRTSRGGLALSLVGSLLAASFAFWESPYGDATKQIVARWQLPLVQTTPQDPAPTVALMSPELMQRLQTMARDLANVAQGIEQLKYSQEQLTRDNATVAEQLKSALSQMTRDDAAAAEQFKAALSQIARDNAAIAGQLKASQEQTVRPGAPRMPVRILPQVEPQPETRIRRLDAY
jgi:hypothetical protein